jgi:hypothetical protein
MKKPLYVHLLLVSILLLGCEKDNPFSVFDDIEGDYKIELMGDEPLNLEGSAEDELMEYKSILFFEDIKDFNFNGFSETYRQRYSLSFFLTERVEEDPMRIDVQFLSRTTGFKAGVYDILDGEEVEDIDETEGFTALIFYDPGGDSPSFYRSTRGTVRIINRRDGNKDVMFDMQLTPLFGSVNWLNAKGRITLYSN